MNFTKRGFIKSVLATAAAAVIPHPLGHETHVTFKTEEKDTGQETQKTSQAHIKGSIPPRPIQPDIDILADAIEEKAKRVPKGQTLFVPVGGLHSYPTHAVSPFLIANTLRQRGRKIAYGDELPYNRVLLAQLGFNPLTRDGLDTIRKGGDLKSLFQILSCDGQGHFSAGSFRRYDHAYAKITVENLHMLISASDIPTSFNDAGSYAPNTFDPKDILLEDVSQRYGIPPEAILDVLNPASIHLRNIIMAENAANHAAHTEAEIYIEDCGGTHVLGSKSGYPFEESLTSTIMQKGHPVFPILFNDPDAKNPVGEFARLPQAAEDFVQNNNALLISNFPNDCFNYNHAEDPDAIKRVTEEEASYLVDIGMPDIAARMPIGTDNNIKSCGKPSHLTIKLERILGYSLQGP